MNHQNKGRKFGRKKGQRRAFFKGLATNLITHGRIETTEARAKEIRSLLERLVTLGKKQNLASLRLMIARVGKKPAEKVFYDIAPKYKDRKGGYFRIIKTSDVRRRDAAKKAVIEFI